MLLECSVLLLPSKKPVLAAITIGKVTEFFDKKHIGYKLIVKFRNKDSRTFKLNKETVNGIIDRFVAKGKATICFTEADLLISEANPDQLRHFVLSVKQCLSWKPDSNKPLQLTGVCSTAVKENLPRPGPKKLEFLERKDYFDLVNAKTGFPTSLEGLVVSIRLKTVDPRWFALRNLTRLNLDGNLFSELKREAWKKFENIRKLTNLQELSLRDNRLQFLPSVFIEALPLNLVQLDVSDNELTYLPPKLVRLPYLSYFSAANNKIETIPENFIEMRMRLTHLFLQNNRLRHIPRFLTRFHFVQTDFSDNSLYPGVKTIKDKNNRSIAPTLLDLAAATVLNKTTLSKKADEVLPLLVKHHLYDSVLTCTYCLRFCPVSGLHVMTSNFLDPALFSDVTTRIGAVEARVVICCRCKLL